MTTATNKIREQALEEALRLFSDPDDLGHPCGCNPGFAPCAHCQARAALAMPKAGEGRGASRDLCAALAEAYARAARLRDDAEASSPRAQAEELMLGIEAIARLTGVLPERRAALSATAQEQGR